MLDKFGSTLKNVMNKIANAVFVDKKLIEDVIKQLQRSLIEADVDVSIAREISEKLRRKASENIRGLEKKEQIVDLLYKELIEILGKDYYELEIDKEKRPFKIMLVGLYGVGKTTSAAKIGFYYSKRGYKVALLGLDVHRPAAPEQLEQMGKKANLTVFVDKDEKNPLAIYEKFKEKLSKFDIVLIDSAGRDVLNNELINEIKLVHETVKPDKVILTIAGDIGKAAKRQAEGFTKACKINGVILTRLDGTAKGGGALISCSETKSPVIFIGTGEKINDIESYDPEAFVSRLLGMGDLNLLLEKAKLAIEEKQQKKMQERLEEGKFTLNDMYDQIKAMQTMGPLNKISELIPGLGALSGKKDFSKLFNAQEDKMKRWKYAIDSMTPTERENPEVMNSSRIARISKGSNVPTSEIKELINQHKVMKNMIIQQAQGMKGLQGIDPEKLARGDLQGMKKKDLMKLAKKFKGMK